MNNAEAVQLVSGKAPLQEKEIECMTMDAAIYDQYVNLFQISNVIFSTI